MVSPDFHKRPELQIWQRDLLDAFYTLARARQCGLDVNPISLVEMEAMTRLNQSVAVYEPLDLIDIWQALDQEMRSYWEGKRKERSEREEQRKKVQAASP